MRLLCALCGQPDYEHHDFEPGLEIPDNCQCDTGEWFGAESITQICDEYADNGARYCKKCYHSVHCHDRTVTETS